ncbi:MAG TPA: rod shape-determining protein MreC [Bryobacteraceae bacterium]|jgi:rod shape-determining protein MreC
MENLFNRYRNFTTLILVLFAQLVLLAYQVKNKKDVPFLRFWTVTAVTPIATVIEDVRSGVAGFFENYFTLRDVRSENKRMRDELGRLKLENQFLKTELSTAERAKYLEAFTAQSPSKMLAARIIAAGTGANNKVVFVDRGSNSGVQKGMGVVTPDGIVGIVNAAFPTSAQVLLVTDPGFAAGVISQKNHTRGVLKGLNYGRCKVDYVENEQKVDMGEMFFTSGDDRVFPKGLTVGKVTAVHDGGSGKEIYVSPTALEDTPEDVLIILQGVDQAITEHQTPAKSVYLGHDSDPDQAQNSGPANAVQTAADKVMEKYKEIGEQQGHKYGVNPSGARPIDFNIKLNPNAPKPAADAKAGSNQPQAAPGEVLESDVTEEAAPRTPPPTAPPPSTAPAAQPKAPPAQPKSPAPATPQH